MTPAEVSGAVVAAVRAAVAGSADVRLSCPDAGVYRTAVALEIGRPDQAEVIAEALAGHPGIGAVRVEGPGFLTVVVAEPGALAAGIVAAGAAYGRAGEVPANGRWADRPRTFGNPGFSVRYAYARAAAVQRRGDDLGVRAGPPEGLGHPDERRLLQSLAELPAKAEQAVREADAGPLMRQLERVAGRYHEVYEHCPALPAGDEKPGAVHAARRTLAEATRIAVGNGLQMIGETPRERI